MRVPATPPGRGSRPILAATFMGLALGAQATWGPILRKAFPRLGPDEALLLVRPEVLQKAKVHGDDLLLRLEAEGQLTLGAAPAPPGLPDGTRWVLLNAQGDEGGRGNALPNGQTVVDFLRGQGHPPRWERREAFLREHPDQGEAREEAVSRAMSLAILKLRVKVQNVQIASTLDDPSRRFAFHWATYVFTSPEPERREEQADQLFGDLVLALEALHRVEGWQHRDGNWNLTYYDIFGARHAPLFRKLCRDMVGDAEHLIQQGNGGMVDTEWCLLSSLGGNPPGTLPQGLPLPGQLWPSPVLIHFGMAEFLQASDWDGALKFLAAAEASLPQEEQDPDHWAENRGSRAMVAFDKVMPLLQQGKEAEALATLREALRLSGSMKILGETIGRSFLEFYSPGLPLKLQAALKAPAQPDAPKPPPLPALRLTLNGRPPWLADWEKLPGAEAFLPWSPAELAWVRGDPASAPGWTLTRGSELLAAGETCPKATALAGVLAAQGPTRLQKLDAILQAQPDHTAARLARVEALKARMPERRLEPRLAEDERALMPYGCTRLEPPLEFGPDAPWQPDPALWQWSALQVLPRLQSALERWPGSYYLWRAWLAWSRFHPARPSPVELARSLPIWPTREAWANGLGLPIHRSVSETLLARHDYQGLLEWLAPVWAAQDKTPARDLSERALEDGTLEARQELGDAVVKPLRQTLVALGRPEEAQDLARTYQAMVTR